MDAQSNGTPRESRRDHKAKDSSTMRPTFRAIIAHSEPMQALLRRLERVIPSTSSILLIGETGVGKEMVAEYIHRHSPRRNHRFVPVSLSCIPESLLESELFGHVKGSFTCANETRKGLFEVADKGTILLDDIDDVPLMIQVKLLRVLESREIVRIGARQPIPIDVRLIAASKMDLKPLVDDSRFRSDLYYRISVEPILIPPLRDRGEDIPDLMRHFLSSYAPGPPPVISPDALALLVGYTWPGNVRELRNIAERLAPQTNELISAQDLPSEIRDGCAPGLPFGIDARMSADESGTFRARVDRFEAVLLRKALEEADGNQTQAARIFGLSLSTFRDKLRKHGLLRTCISR